MAELSLPIDDVDDERAAALLMWRAHRALLGAPDVVSYVRALSISGKPEGGETLREWSAPLRVTPADDADSVFAQLVDWVIYWSEELGEAPPSVSVIASRDFYSSHESQGFVDAPVRGFRAGTSAGGAHALVALQTIWLQLRRERIAEHEQAGAYFADVVDLLQQIGARYPTSPRAERAVSPRPCPICGERAIGADWRSEDIRDVVVACAHCGHVIEARTYRKVLEWLA